MFYSERGLYTKQAGHMLDKIMVRIYMHDICIVPAGGLAGVLTLLLPVAVILVTGALASGRRLM
jgi:hypothetical protein